MRLSCQHRCLCLLLSCYLACAGSRAWSSEGTRLLDRWVDAAYLPNAPASAWVRPSSQDLQAFEQLVSGLLAQAALAPAELPPGLVAQATALDFECLETSPENVTLWILRERTQQGRGLYLFRVGPAAPLIIQAPHVRNDQLSERLAVRAFWQSAARLACFSTLSRNTVEPAGNYTYGEADLSHQDRSHFTAATRAGARTLARATLVQFHGFGSEHQLPARSLVLSNGTRQPDSVLFACAGLIADRWRPLALYIYPNDYRSLGGLLNAQGAVIQRFPIHSFLHLEISRELREALAIDEGNLLDLRSCLGLGLPATTPVNPPPSPTPIPSILPPHGLPQSSPSDHGSGEGLVPLPAP